MKITSVFIVLLIIIFYPGCSHKEILSSSPKKLTVDEIKRLNHILVEIRDTLIINFDKTYERETYSYLPDSMRITLQRTIIEKGLPLRADSSYFLGFYDAINNIMNGNLVYKSSGLERVLQIDGIEHQWKADVVHRYILLNTYSITTDVIAGDLVNESIMAYKEGYNKIFRPAVNNFYGFDVIQKAYDEISEVIINESDEHVGWIYQNKY